MLVLEEKESSGMAEWPRPLSPFAHEDAAGEIRGALGSSPSSDTSLVALPLSESPRGK